MSSIDKALALSGVETESLRALRARLNRPAGDKAAAVLLKMMFQVAERVELEADSRTAPLQAATSAEFKARVAVADMAQLRGAVAALRLVHAQGPAASLKALGDGMPQAVVSRRLALAGREPPLEDVGAPRS